MVISLTWCNRATLPQPRPPQLCRNWATWGRSDMDTCLCTWTLFSKVCVAVWCWLLLSNAICVLQFGFDGTKAPFSPFVDPRFYQTSSGENSMENSAAGRVLSVFPFCLSHSRVTWWWLFLHLSWFFQPCLPTSCWGRSKPNWVKPEKSQWWTSTRQTSDLTATHQRSANTRNASTQRSCVLHSGVQGSLFIWVICYIINICRPKCCSIVWISIQRVVFLVFIFCCNWNTSTTLYCFSH